METHTRSKDDNPRDRRDFHNDIRTMSPAAQQHIRHIENRGWVHVSEIAPEDLVDMSRWFGKELGVVQTPYGKLRLILGTEDQLIESQILAGEIFVVHTHPVMRTLKSHFKVDVPNAGDRVEAVIDWGGQIAYFSKSVSAARTAQRKARADR